MKKPVTSSAILNVQSDDKYCFICLILAHLNPIASSKAGHLTRLWSQRQKIVIENIRKFVFSNGFKGCDGHVFKKLKNLTMNKHISIPIEISEN